MDTKTRTESPLTTVAHRLGVRYQRALNWVLTQRLLGRKTTAGNWVVSNESVDRVAKELELSGVNFPSPSRNRTPVGGARR